MSTAFVVEAWYPGDHYHREEHDAEEEALASCRRHCLSGSRRIVCTRLTLVDGVVVEARAKDVVMR